MSQPLAAMPQIVRPLTVSQPLAALQQLPDDVTSLPADEIFQVVPSVYCVQHAQLTSALEVMTRCSTALAGLTAWIDRFLQLPERQRRLLSHFGAIGQDGDNWGVDAGNVIYSILWKYFCASNVAKKLWQFHQITSLNGSVGDDISWKPSSSF